MDKVKKQKMVKVWMAFGFPTLGSSESQANLVAGSDFLTFWKGTHGLKVEASVQFLDNTFGTFELQAIEPFDVFEGQPWFKAFTVRFAYERGKWSSQIQDSYFCREKKTHVHQFNTNLDPTVSCVFSIRESTLL